MGRNDSRQSDSQFLAATTTTGGQHAATVLGGHTGTEAMHLAALTLLGLVGTEHLQHSFAFEPGRNPSLLTKYSLCSISDFTPVVKRFMGDFQPI